MIDFSFPNEYQNYVRRILCSAYHLQRKFFPDLINKRFDADFIYDKIVELINKITNSNKSLKKEIIFLKQKINLKI